MIYQLPCPYPFRVVVIKYFLKVHKERKIKRERKEGKKESRRVGREESKKVKKEKNVIM